MDNFIDTWIQQTFGNPQDAPSHSQQVSSSHGTPKDHHSTKLLVCNACGHVHFAQTYAQILEQALNFGDYIQNADAHTREQFGFGSGCKWSLQEHLNGSMKCFGCGAPYTHFHAATDEEVEKMPRGITLQPLLDKDTEEN